MEPSEIGRRVAVRNTLVRYSHMLNRNQWHLIDEVLTPDAVVDASHVGANRCAATDLRGVVTSARPAALRFERLHLSDVACRVLAARATATYKIKFERFEDIADRPGTVWCTRVEGTEVAHLVDTRAGWRIAATFGYLAGRDRTQLTISDGERGETADHESLVSAGIANSRPLGRWV